MKNATIFILYKILIGSLWGRQLANKPAAFSLVTNRQPTQYVEQREAPHPPSRQLWRHRVRAFVKAWGIPRAVKSTSFGW
jgi:hypothetical protein